MCLEKTPLNPFKIIALMLAYFSDGVHRGATARLCFAQHRRASGTWDCLAPDSRINEMAIENEIAYVEGIEKYSPRSGLVQQPQAADPASPFCLQSRGR